MKIPFIFSSLAILTLILTSCGVVQINPNAKSIMPSDNMISEKRQVSGFTGIQMSTVGKVIITQGDSESLEIKGSDNLVPLIKTTVGNGVLTIRLDENYTLNSLNKDDLLIFTLTVKDLNNVTLSGAGTVEMSALTTQSLKLVMSGAGSLSLANLKVDNLDITVSGLGNTVVSGTATSASMGLSGAGEIQAGDLQCQSVKITISGLGSATIWATDTLTGNISGGGNVRYYGSPKMDTKTTGFGNFESLGSK
jgi:hypothetical protein